MLKPREDMDHHSRLWGRKDDRGEMIVRGRDMGGQSGGREIRSKEIARIFVRKVEE